MKEQKLKLIREAENLIGFRKFKVGKRSTEEELNNVLSFIHTAYHELESSIIPQINNYEL